MPTHLKSAGKTAATVQPAQQASHSFSNPSLNGAMACDTAFRIIARRHLANLGANREATANGDPSALHQMRIALTHLRTVILFFSPMVDDRIQREIKTDLKWLNTELGAVRDLDVAIERIKLLDKDRPLPHAALLAWDQRRAEGHRHLARVLRSARYRLLMARVSGWIENGPWSSKKSKLAAKQRSQPIGDYSAGKLAQWEAKLLKRSRDLQHMGTKRRHRLRLLNKKLSYAVESFEDLFAEKRFSREKSALTQLRKAQKSLGQLNDGARGDALASELEQSSSQLPLQFLNSEQKRRLLKAAAKAYSKLATLK